MRGVRYLRRALASNMKKDTTVSTVVKTDESKTQEARPTISLARVISNVPATGSFSGWGPVVGGSADLTKNWN